MCGVYEWLWTGKRVPPRVVWTHPICLISFMVVHRHCALCKAPFHERLYKLFGLVPYMPSSWKCNPENIPSLRHLWVDDLVWSWRLHDHSYNKSNISSQFQWENNHEEVVRVCQRLVLEFRMKEKEISSTNALVAIGMRQIRDSN